MQDGEKFIISEDAARGVTVFGWYEGDNLHYQGVQEVPDEFFQQTHELAADWSPNQKRRSHYQQFASIPAVLQQKWCEEFGVKTLHEDGDVFKKILQRLSSSEFRKLRTGGGRLA